VQPKECLADGFARADHRLEHCNRYGTNDGSHRALSEGVNPLLAATRQGTRPYLIARFVHLHGNGQDGLSCRINVPLEALVSRVQTLPHVLWLLRVLADQLPRILVVHAELSDV
jgi:hypothetical protein